MRTFEDIHLMVLRNDVEGLMKAAKDADETIRLEAVKALKAINPIEAKDVIEQAKSDPSAKVRRAALGISLGEESLHKTLADQAQAVVVDVPDEVRDKRNPLRWLWIVLGTWGVALLLLTMLILVAMFSGGNFGNSGQIIGVLVLGIPGAALLWVAVKMLKEGGKK
jgi:hypothetical protein